MMNTFKKLAALFLSILSITLFVTACKNNGNVGGFTGEISGTAESTAVDALDSSKNGETSTKDKDSKKTEITEAAQEDPPQPSSTPTFSVMPSVSVLYTTPDSSSTLSTPVLPSQPDNTPTYPKTVEEVFDRLKNEGSLRGYLARDDTKKKEDNYTISLENMKSIISFQGAKSNLGKKNWYPSSCKVTVKPAYQLEPFSGKLSGGLDAVIEKLEEYK